MILLVSKGVSCGNTQHEYSCRRQCGEVNVEKSSMRGFGVLMRRCYISARFSMSGRRARAVKSFLLVSLRWGEYI